VAERDGRRHDVGGGLRAAARALLRSVMRRWLCGSRLTYYSVPKAVG